VRSTPVVCWWLPAAPCPSATTAAHPPAAVIEFQCCVYINSSNFSDSLTVRSFTLQLLVVNWHPTILNIAKGHVLGRRLLPADKQSQGITISSPQLMLTSVLPLRVSTTSEWSEAISSITICCYKERGCKYLGHRRLNMSMAGL